MENHEEIKEDLIELIRPITTITLTNDHVRTQDNRQLEGGPFSMDIRRYFTTSYFIVSFLTSVLGTFTFIFSESSLYK
jgi:hypothetical protein